MADMFQESIISGFSVVCVCVCVCVCVSYIDVLFLRLSLKNLGMRIMNSFFLILFPFLANFLKKLIKENIETKKTT